MQYQHTFHLQEQAEILSEYVVDVNTRKKKLVWFAHFFFSSIQT